MKFSLYGYWRSSSSWRVRLALAHKAIPYTYIPVHLVDGGGQQHAAAFTSKNPMHQVPLLEVEAEGGRTHRIAQSMAIMELLEEVVPTPSIWPLEPLERARARELAELVNSGIQPLQNLAVIQHLRDELGLDASAFCAMWIARGLEAYQRRCEETRGTFSVGDNVSVADFCLVPQLYNARRFKVDLSPFQSLLEIESACESLESFQKAHPDAQPDRPVS